MSFLTLTKRGRLSSHIKQSSFDVSELAAAGRMNYSSSSDMAPSPLSPFKKLTRLFRRQTSEPALRRSNQSITSFSGEHQIFGRPLSEICSPEPPKPITDLLIFLQDVGPFTREIFRKPPNARRCKLLSDKLNFANFYWDIDESCNGLLLAAVLKTFLREIPNKLCDDRMFDQWSTIFQEMSKDNHEQRVTATKRLICRLPESNQLLLKHVIFALHKIQLRSHENLMTSYNLSVCLGPCLVWTQSTNFRDIEKASRTVPKLVQFMIENCDSLFGQDTLNLHRSNDKTLERNTSMSLDSVFTDKQSQYLDPSHCIDALTDQLGRQQMSPSRLSYDSGMILDDASHDEDIGNITKTSRPIHKRFNVSYDSLDCDGSASDEEISDSSTKLDNNNSLYVNTAELSIAKSRKPTAVASNGTITKENCSNNAISYQSRLPPISSKHKSNTVQELRRTPRPSVLPLKVDRKPSVSYDKIVYRYISDNDSQRDMTSQSNKFYSLPRPTKSYRTSTISSDFENKLQQTNAEWKLRTMSRANSNASHRTSSVNRRQSQHNALPVVPTIVINKPQTDATDHPSKHQERINNNRLRQPPPLPSYPRRTSAINSPTNNFYENAQQTLTNKHRIDNIPIYENSELYGPSLTVSRCQPQDPHPVPLYVNLAFHRQPPTTRQRRRTLNTTSNYSTYKQQTYSQGTLPRLPPENRAASRTASIASDNRQHNQLHSYGSRKLFHETCYFV